MSLFFITGTAGTGKTTIKNELVSRGYKALDTDADALSKWHNLKTGYVHPKSSVKSKDRTPEFLKDHRWKVPRKDIEELAALAKNDDIFLCGVSYGEEEYIDLFDAVFALVIDDETLKYRLIHRTSGDWGKQPHELQQSLDRQQYLNSKYTEFNYQIIDATQPLNAVIEQILTKVQEPK